MNIQRLRTTPTELGAGHWRIDDLRQGGDWQGNGATYDRSEECWVENPVRVENDTLVEESVVTEWRTNGENRVPCEVGTRISPRGSEQWDRWVDGDDNIRSTPLPLDD